MPLLLDKLLWTSVAILTGVLLSMVTGSTPLSLGVATVVGLYGLSRVNSEVSGDA